MFASVRHYTRNRGPIDALVHRVDEEFAPALAQEPGFVAYFAIETGDHTLETISIFTNREAAQRSDELAAEYVADELGEFGLVRTEQSAGEVRVSRVADEVTESQHRWRRGGFGARVI